MKQELLGIKAPEKECTDKKCPFHGEIKVKKELFKGRVVSKDIHHSATIEWFRPNFIPKYERYEIRRTKIRVHNPSCINADLGEEVVVARTRPLSKTKNHVILKVIGEKKLAIDVENLIELEEEKEGPVDEEEKERGSGERKNKEQKKEKDLEENESR